jgi:hypothetical protein
MSCDDAEQAFRDHLEISIRFRRTIEERIARLESDAASDQALTSCLEHPDHIRRQLRLVTAQRDEAARMRRFLNQSRTRETSSVNPL